MKTTTVNARRDAGVQPTVTPLSEAVAKASNQSGADVEFCRVADCRFKWGLKRGTIYNLAKEGKIVLRHYRKRGALRGITLVDVASVRRFLAKLPTHASEARP